MTTSDPSNADPSPTTVRAGALAPWDVGQLPPPPSTRGWQLWVSLFGPGLVLASTAIGSGEWLIGPALTAQYGASLLWLATLSIGFQVFCNLMMMRYAVYCGEPIIVGGLRTWPGPRAWIPFYLLLDIAAFFPFNAANAAVPLAAAFLGRLPGEDDKQLVKGLGYTVFLVCFVPLIFGGTVYRMIEKVMTIKLVYVLTFLVLATLIMVPGAVWWEVTSGFFRFGTVPLRAETIVSGRHFHLVERDAEGDVVYQLRGVIEKDEPTIADFVVIRDGKKETFKLGKNVPDAFIEIKERMTKDARKIAQPGKFFIRSREDTVVLTAAGTIDDRQQWHGERFTVTDAQSLRSYDGIAAVPEPYAHRFQELVAGRGLTEVNLIGYVQEHGKLPPLDWPTLASFIAIAGLGGFANTLFSNYTRDKGWGMGHYVGAIPSAFGGRSIGLSHTGRVFPWDDGNRTRWFGWLRHIRRDQMVWMVANFIGMALPCMLSLEFIRHASVSGDRVAAMTADGMAERYPDYRWVLWGLTLFCGFMILAPGQVSSGDQIARRWTDIIWTGTRWSKRMSAQHVKYVYYGILALYAVIGLVTLTLFDPLVIVKIAAVLMNVALGSSSLHALYVNRSLLPRAARPSLLLQVGTFFCGMFFLGISVIVLVHL